MYSHLCSQNKRGLGAFIFAANVENREKREEGGGQEGVTGVCVPVSDNKSRPLVKGVIHHSLLGIVGVGGGCLTVSETVCLKFEFFLL